MITSEDLRHINLMLQLIKNYQNNEIYLDVLVSKLEGLFRLIYKTNEPWRKIFFENLLNLESTYAGALSEQRLTLDEDERKLVDKWVADLNDLPQGLLKDYQKNPDSNIEKIAKELEKGWLLCPNCTDAWETLSKEAMVICPNCGTVLHNPCYSNVLRSK